MSNVFSDTENCMSCDNPLKNGALFYCDAICRARDGAEKDQVDQPHFGLAHTHHRPGDSPSILASLPPLIASAVQAQAIIRQRSQGASASNSSHSENSSPLQSPSPLTGHPIAAVEGSPREDMFLPPPAFQNPNNVFMTHPVKIPSSYHASPPPPSNSTYGSRPSSFKGEPATAVNNDSTLHYGRRPAQTNSMTSPLALYPQGGLRRRESGGTGLKPNFPRLSPALKPTRVVSDSRFDKEHQINSSFKPGFAYGMHSPLVLAANRRPSTTTSVVDLTVAKSRHSPTSFDADVVKPSGSSSHRPKSTDVYGYAGVQIRASPSDSQFSGKAHPSSTSSASERRKSFPAHLLSMQRPALAPYAPSQPSDLFVEEENTITNTTAAFANSPRRGRSRQRNAEGAVEREWSRSRTSSRSSREKDESASSRNGRVGRPGSQRRPSNSNENNRVVGMGVGVGVGTPLMQSTKLPSPPRQYGIPPPPSASTAKIISPQPTPSRAIGVGETMRNTFLGRDLSTIMASYQQPGAVQPRFGVADEEKDDITEEEVDARERDRRGRRARESSPKNGRGRKGTGDRMEEDSRAAKELKRLFEEGVPAM